MRAAYSAIRTARTAAILPRVTQLRHASSLLRMPAMSPTMTEGGIAGWKVKEGESYAAGDVILEVETDKATIDVEAQDDGVMGKILFESGAKNVPVGEAIAVLAEEGDDLSKLEVPTDLAPEKQNIPTEDKPAAPKESQEAPKESPKESAPASSSTPVHREIDHSIPMLPSAARLLSVSDLSDDKISKIKPTGRNGLLTKGDVLAALGKVSSPYGSAEKLITDPMGPSGKRASEAKSSSSGSAAAAKPEPPLDGPSLRRLIVAGMTKSTAPVAPKEADKTLDAAFDDIVADYLPKAAAPAPAAPAPAPAAAEDELAGLI